MACRHCEKGKVQVWFKGKPLVKEPCPICHPEEAAAALKTTQALLNKRLALEGRGRNRTRKARKGGQA